MLRIAANARRLKLRHDIRLVIIDYLQLIDPDNRRAVDYRRREELMAELAPRLSAAEERRALFDTLMHDWRDGRVKLATIALLLAFRREHEEFFANADYQPIEMNRAQAGICMDRDLCWHRVGQTQLICGGDPVGK